MKQLVWIRVKQELNDYPIRSPLPKLVYTEVNNSDTIIKEFFTTNWEEFVNEIKNQERFIDNSNTTYIITKKFLGEDIKVCKKTFNSYRYKSYYEKCDDVKSHSMQYLLENLSIDDFVQYLKDRLNEKEEDK